MIATGKKNRRSINNIKLIKTIIEIILITICTPQDKLSILCTKLINTAQSRIYGNFFLGKSVFCEISRVCMKEEIDDHNRGKDLHCETIILFGCGCAQVEYPQKCSGYFLDQRYIATYFDYNGRLR